MKTEAAGSTKMLVPTYQTTRCHVPEDIYLQEGTELERTFFLS
jgi:hypothetical protein